MTFLKGIKLKNTKYLFILLIVIIIILFIQFSINNNVSPVKEKVPAPTNITISSVKEKLAEPTKSVEKTYYKTETKCQTDIDCIICPSQNTAYPSKTNCQRGECLRGVCYWVHNVSQCQNGYVKFCEGGICQCLRSNQK